jgi:hypothetical protein
MRPEVIDLFVDRLCGIFPKDNIARNTVKNAWNRDDFLLGCDEEHGKIALQMLEHDDTFPNLKRVKEVFRKIKGGNNVISTQQCKICKGSGWDDGLRYIGNVCVQERYEEEGIYGMKYHVAKRCECHA